MIVADHLIQKAIINKLSTSPYISGTLRTEIREEQFQDTGFSYPNIRIGIANNIPLGNAVGHTKLSSVNIVIVVSSEKPSSLECNTIASTVTDILFDSQIKGTNESGQSNYFILNRLDLVERGQAIRTEEEKWEKEIQFRSDVYKL